MIKLTATALIHYISPVQEIPSKNGGQPFYKQELVLDDSWTKDGKTNPNYVCIEFSGDKIQQLDAYMVGQTVTVEAFVSGREYQGRYFNSIRGLSVAPYQQPQTSQTAPPPGSYTQWPPAYPTAPGYPQQSSYPGGYPQQGGYAQAPAPAPMPGTPQGGDLGPDGLPFR